eukprot:symbB.v1.2.039047.t1/scaffold6315.1/size19090/1
MVANAPPADDGEPNRLPPGHCEKWQSGQKKSATSVASAAKLKSWLRSSWSVNRINRRSGSCSKSRIKGLRERRKEEREETLMLWMLSMNRLNRRISRWRCLRRH